MFYIVSIIYKTVEPLCVETHSILTSCSIRIRTETERTKTSSATHYTMERYAVQVGFEPTRSLQAQGSKPCISANFITGQYSYKHKKPSDVFPSEGFVIL